MNLPKDLRKKDLSSANLLGATLDFRDLRGALLPYDLRGVSLKGANLSNVDLHMRDLTDANLEDANLCGANLRGAVFRNTNLAGANLLGAMLISLPQDLDAPSEWISLIFSDLSKANLTGTVLPNGIRIEG
jgi:uncharacterized protein YjbI with pentapeptide repeats